MLIGFLEDLENLKGNNLIIQGDNCDFQRCSRKGFRTSEKALAF